MPRSRVRVPESLSHHHKSKCLRSVALATSRTQGLPCCPSGADEPSSIAKLAGCGGDRSREEVGKGPLDPLIELWTHADASSEHDELQIEERLQCHYSDGHPARRRIEDRRRHFVSLLEEPENIAYRSGGGGSALAPVSIHDGV